MQKKQLILNHKQVSYLEAGEGEPLLLIHGWLYTKESFEKILPLLSKNYHVIAPDLPGFGESQALAAEKIEDYLEFLEQFARELGWDKFNLLGNSFGGTLSLLYSLKQPHQINKLILRVPLFKRQQLHFLISNKLSRAFFKFTSQLNFFQKLFRKLIIKLHDKINTNGAHHESNSLILQQNLTNLSLTAARNLIIEGLYLDIEQQLKQLRIPTLIIWAEADKLLDPTSGKELNLLIPDSLLEYHSGPHSIFAANAEQTAASIINFLKK